MLDISLSEISSPVSVSLYKILQYDSNTFFICGGKDNYGVILKSADGGKAFKIFKEFDKPVYSLGTYDGINFLAGCDKAKILRSHDAGNNWDEYIDYAGVGKFYQVPLRDIKFITPKDIFICGGDDFMNGLIYKSHDGGYNWSKTEVQHELRQIDFYDGTNGTVVGYGSVMQTADTGNTWQVINDETGEFFTGICWQHPEKAKLCGYSGGIYSLSDGSLTALKNKNNSSSTTREHYNTIDFYGNSFFCSGFNGASAYSINNGENLKAGKSFDAQTIYCVVLTGQQTGIACGANGKIFRFSF